ncbi:MAG: hypothetical protein ACI4V1_00205, partial [Eubacteriales bacterium]
GQEFVQRISSNSRHNRMKMIIAAYHKGVQLAMKPNAVIYKSNTGYTRQYALLFGEKTGLPVYPLDEAMQKLAPGSSVLFFGWLMAGKVQGYQKAAKRYHIAAVCGVGMGATGSQLQDLRKANPLPASMPVYTLQGGFDLKRLRGVYKWMMTIMAKTVGKKLADKKDRTPDEDAMLDLMFHGGSRVSEENLAEVLDWYQNAP